MAAVTRPLRPVARAAAPGEGTVLADLWRVLWDTHEAWGGYPGSPDPRIYKILAHRLDEDARVRAGHPVLGRHAHLVADLGGPPCGQVEGWLEQHGASASVPVTCEVRSLIVSERARGLGVGRALLDALAQAGRSMAYGRACVLAAEVLEPNPAQAFYARLGYRPVSWSTRIEMAAGGSADARGGRSGTVHARLAVAGDAFAVARLEVGLAARRRAAGDVRFDAPRAIDASTVDAVAAQIASDGAPSLQAPARLVAVDAGGAVRGAASFAVDTLEPPFVPNRRALLGRFALDGAFPGGAPDDARGAAATAPVLAALIDLGCRLAADRGASCMEVTDLSAPGTPLYDAALAAGARPWSRIVTKSA
jgi:GNAT superfamily N-acetyltransferase